MEQNLEKINKYLNNQMSQTERKEFEILLDKDVNIAKELEFQKELMTFFDKREPDVRADLKALGDEFITGKSNSHFFPKWLFIPIFLIIGTIGYFVLQNNKTTNQEFLPENNVESTVKQEQEETPVIEEVKTEEIQEEDATSEEEKIKETTTESNTEEVVEGPFAALDDDERFEPNPLVEKVLQETYRAETKKITTTLSIPKKDANFKYATNIPLKVQGTTAEKPNYQLAVYTNKTFDIENDYPVLNTTLEGTAISNGFSFKFDGSVSLEKGLYYLFIRSQEDLEVLHVSRFIVK